MSSKRSFKIKKLINKNIKVGDTVKIVDGSGISLKNNYNKKIYIVNYYPELTGSNSNLKDINATVVKTGVKNYVCEGVSGFSFRQDVVIKIGNSEFRTFSKSLRLVEETFKVGDIFYDKKTDNKYLLSQVLPSKMCLIDLGSTKGNRCVEPFRVNNIFKVTKDELKNMCNNKLNLIKI